MKVLSLCLTFLFIHLAFLSFAQSSFKAGTWRGVLTLSEKKNEIILPFNFDVNYVKGKPVIDVRNAEEKIEVTEVTVLKDSVIFKMPVFDSEFRTQLKNDTLTGTWINYAKKEKNRIPFEAYYGDKNRFVTEPVTAGKENALLNFSGKYEVTFNAKKEDEYKAIGVFNQKGNILTGTFLTETGDYRFLEGVVQNNNMVISCFDGSHAFLFFANSAKLKGNADSLTGRFYAGISGTEDWVAVRNETFELKDPESITYLKNPNERISFSFPNLNKKTVSLSDEKFRNKVVIIEIMGTWCPNCMDETTYLAKLYKQYKSKGLEIVALAYERTTDFEKAKNNALRSKTKFGADYEFLITGLTGKAKASESFPFLNSISAFPTTIILDRDHNVKSIYTGFNGPATGKVYEQYKKKTEDLIESLLMSKH
jgi:thiol-disulfide isomerase/thioredoxin